MKDKICPFYGAAMAIAKAIIETNGFTMKKEESINNTKCGKFCKLYNESTEECSLGCP